MTTILLWTHAGKLHGMGHLSRSLQLLRALEKYARVVLCVGGRVALDGVLGLKDFECLRVPTLSTLQQTLTTYAPQLIITDRLRTTKAEMLLLRNFSKVLAIDDTGDGRVYANSVLYPLPLPSSCAHFQRNFSGLEYLVLGKDLESYQNQKKRLTGTVQHIVMSFGGEDPFRIAWKMRCVLEKLSRQYQITLVFGPLYSGPRDFKGIECISSPEDLHAVLLTADCVVTSFGLTAYEALYLGLPVILVNGSEYHNGVAEQEPAFVNLGTVSQGSLRLYRRLEEALQEPLLQDKTTVLRHARENTCRVVLEVAGMGLDHCAVCGGVPRVIRRDNALNFYHCEKCKSLFRSASYTCSKNYSDAYFTTEYTHQYGRSYAEDKPAINRLNEARLRVIEGLCPKPLRLLELGSALGFFLEMARERGYDVQGVEVSSYAVAYARDVLGLNVFEGSFLEFEDEPASYDVVCAWYFIEHHPNYRSILKKVRGLLKVGGMLALSTPNAYGMSFRLNPLDYTMRMPADHFIEFSPESLALCLDEYGFQTVSQVSTGLHLDRMRRFLRVPVPRLRYIERVLLWTMKRLRLGDTFELYSIRG